MSRREKVCFVVQRYGVEVNGGGEQECRQYAEHLISLYDVSVVTTKALEYSTWENWYTADEEIINGVKVYRFPVDKPREQSEFNEVSVRLHNSPHDLSIQQDWIDKQGPYCPRLIKFLKEHKNDFDVFLFSGYLYYTTIIGLPVVKDKAILISLAHDEPFLQLERYQKLFYMPRAFFFNTDEERALVRQKFGNFMIPSSVGGVGVDEPLKVDDYSFCQKYHLNHFMIYVGRIDEGKNCHTMFRDFIRYKQENLDSDLKLVLLGKTVISIPKRNDIVPLGFVSEEDKYNGIAASDFLVLPSQYESLSMVVLEAFSLAKPVLVNGKCPVLKSHCLKSHGGFAFEDYTSFADGIEKLEKDSTLRHSMGEAGYRYVKRFYNWDIIVRKLSDLIEDVIENPRFVED